MSDVNLLFAMEKFWHDLAGQGDFYNRDGRTDKGDAYRQIAHDLSAVLKKIRLTPPATDATEREHCERACEGLVGGANHAPWLLSERAAVRAECQAEIERLRASHEALRVDLFDTQRELAWTQARLERTIDRT
jgi:hypothetical protein